MARARLVVLGALAVTALATGTVQCSTLLGMHPPTPPEGGLPKADGGPCRFDDDASRFDDTCGFGEP